MNLFTAISKDTIKEIKTYYTKTDKTNGEIADAVGVSKTTVKKYAKMMDLKRPPEWDARYEQLRKDALNKKGSNNAKLRTKAPTNARHCSSTNAISDCAVKPMAPKDTVYEQKVSDLKRLIGEVELPFKLRNSAKQRPNKVVTLVTGDQHVPHHDETKFTQAVLDFLQKYPGEYKILVLNGDYMDGHGMNSYGQQADMPTLEEELAEGRIVLNWLSSLFDEVILVDDNHIVARENRWKEQFVPTQYHFKIREIYDLLIEGFPNVRRAKREYDNGETLGWFTIVGDACYGHYEVHSSAILGAAMKLSNFVDFWQEDLGLPDIRLVVEAHVHKGGEYYLPGKDRKIIEGGCMVGAKGVRYAMKANSQNKPSVLGVTHVVQYDGVSDLNECRFFRY